jgi:hypothetical protein
MHPMRSLFPPLFFLKNPFAEAIALFITLFACVVPAFAQTPLYVNEIMASNNNGITDATGAHEDWFEIYNPNDVVVDIAGYYLSDKTANPKKYQIPTGSAETRIQPHGYLVIWASEKPERGPLHAAFALSASGENVVLSAPDGTLIDAVTFGAQTTDVSYGRYPDGSASWVLFSGVTPGANNAGGTTSLPKLSPPVFSEPAGFKTTFFELFLTHPDPDVIIHYTMDGSEPMENVGSLTWKYKNKYNFGSNQDAPGLDQGLLNEGNNTHSYLDPIPIDDKTAAPNRLSMKSSTESYEARYFPESRIFKGTVIRAKAFKAGSLPSETVTRTYFVSPSGANRYSLPVVSLVSDERSFFEYSTGIYTAGRQYDRFLNDNTLNNGNCRYTNFTMDGGDWERRGSFELFENGNPVFSQGDIGFRTHGFCSRRSPQKSLRLYSDTNFGYNFFSNQKANPKRLILRTRGNEPAPSSEFKDLFAQKLIEYLPFDSQSSKPAVMFMNGEYWGLQSIRERFDRFYLEGKYGVDKDNVDVIQMAFTTPSLYEVEEGDSLAFVALKDFIRSADLSDGASYEQLKTMIDLDNYTDYQIAQLIIDNADWPFHNIRLWRAKVPNSGADAPYGHDGRWRFMFYDADYSFFNSQAYNNFINATGGSTVFATLFNKILLNPEYRHKIIGRTADLLNTHFTADRANTILEQFRQTFEPLIPECVDRWKEEPSLLSLWPAPQSVDDWNKSVKAMKDYVTARPAAFREIIRKQFGAAFANFDLKLDVSDPADGYVRVNQIDITSATPGIPANPYPWTGTYFKTTLVRVSPVATPDSYFVRWERSDGFTTPNQELQIIANADVLEYRAVFEKKPVLSNLLVNGASLNPGFSPTTNDYKVTIPASTESVRITPVFGNRAARVIVRVNFESPVSVANGATTDAITLVPGINNITLEVYDAEETSSRFYSVTVNHEMAAPGYAFTFLGTKVIQNINQYVKIDKRIESASFTLEAWIRTSDNSTTGTQGNLATALFNSDKTGDANDFLMGILNNKVSFFDGNSKETTIGETDVVDGRWHHVAVVREAEAAVRIYVDGKLDKENTAGAGRSALDGNSYITLGGNPTDASLLFLGSMDEARIWTTVRTAAEIGQNMYSPPLPGSSGLKAYYNFDIGIFDPDSTVADLTGNGNTGTITNPDFPAIRRMESYAMVMPAVQKATGFSTGGFTANWLAPTTGTAERYFLDVSTDKTFAPGSFVEGFEALEVNGTSQRVTLPAAGREGRTAAMDYYYRVRADKTSVSGQGTFSAVETVLNPLPVTLISFTGKKSEQVNLLEWKVTAEMLFDRYVIERSTDAKTFVPIGSVKAVADGKSEITGYIYADEHLPVSGPAVMYYRLKMIDLDGSSAFSRIVSISNELAVAEVGQVYPNPSRGNRMYIDIDSKEPGTWQIAAFSSGGVLYQSWDTILKKGANRVALPTADLPAGIWMIVFKNGLREEVVRKIVIE